MAGTVEFKNLFLDKSIDEIESCYIVLKNNLWSGEIEMEV